jgi:DNA-binding transcriptional LysR family regulator
MDRFSSLAAFVRVVESGSFSAAARRLNMSKTMVSNHVQALEDRLGARLLNRTTRRLSLTEIGKAYYDRGTQILTDLEEADGVAAALQSTPLGTLRIYCVTQIVPFVSPVVAKFLTAYPTVKVELFVGESSVDMFDEGLDIALRLTPPSDSNLIVRSLATWRHVVCCSQGYIDRYGRVQELAELGERNCFRHVNYPYGDEWRFVDRTDLTVSVRVAGNLISNSGDTLRRAALEGVGICLAPGFLVEDDLHAGRLIRLLPDYRPIELSMNVVYPHRHHVSAKVRIFIDMLVHHSAAHQKLIDPYS